MNILMMTNTFTPFVGGVSRSVTAFSEELRKMGHRVVVVAPEFENMPESECDVIRIPAIQHFNGSDFALVLPIPGYLSTHLERFKPDIVHSHHPHLLGGAAVRIAGRFDCPLVFTYHTMYEHYLHYVPTEAKRLRRFVINLVTGYCDLCDHVIAPSRSVVEILRERGVETPIDVVPTGVDIERFKEGDGCAFRRSHRIPENAFVAGYVGRLAPEKNLSFLAEAVREMAQAKPEQVHAYRQAARATAAEFSMETSAQKLASVYEKVLARDARDSKDESTWGGAIEAIKAEWELIKNIAEAATQTLRKTE